MGRWVAYGRTRKFTKARFAGHERRVDGLWGCGRLEGFRVVLAKGMSRKGVVTMAAKELVESRWIGTAGDGKMFRITDEVIWKMFQRRLLTG